MIGGGIFFMPILVAQLIADPRAVLAVWLAGGALAFIGAMAYAEFAALVMVVNELRRNPGTSAAGVAIIAAGVPVHWSMTSRAPTT